MSLLRDALPPERERARYLLDRHAHLVLDAVKATELSRHDRQQVEHIYVRHFDPVQTQ
jgi:hypothetical protein